MGSKELRCALLILGTTLTIAAPRPARADTAPERPIVQAVAVTPDACFDGASLAQSIAAWLKKGTIDARIAILVRRPNSENVRFTVERASELVGERDLPVGTLPCADLRAAVSLAIAIAVDNTLLESLGIEPPPSTPTEREAKPAVPKEPEKPEPAAAPTPAPRPAPAPTPPETPRRLSFALEAEGLFGLLPGPALGAAPRIGFRPASFLDIRLGALGTTRAQTSVGGGTASASLLAARFELCALGPAKEVRGAVCAGIAAGSVSAEGSGLEPSFSPGLRWAAATARLEARYPASSALAAVAGVEGFVPVLRPELQVVDKNGQIVDSWKAPVVGFGVSLGADLLIW
jgi:outer membrane biosynthesis protein TonB